MFYGLISFLVLVSVFILIYKKASNCSLLHIDLWVLGVYVSDLLSAGLQAYLSSVQLLLPLQFHKHTVGHTSRPHPSLISSSPSDSVLLRIMHGQLMFCSAQSAEQAPAKRLLTAGKMVCRVVIQLKCWFDVCIGHTCSQCSCAILKKGVQ